MSTHMEGQRLTATRRLMEARIVEALDAGASLALLENVYTDMTGDDSGAGFTSLVRRAEVIRAWRSDRKRLADEYEALTGRIPGTWTVEELAHHVATARSAGDAA